eukprot:scaffold85772_cov61-Attheya_sp.AAC.4
MGVLHSLGLLLRPSVLVVGACARGPRAAESNEFQGWCGDELRQAYKNRFLSFEFLRPSVLPNVTPREPPRITAMHQINFK